MWHQKGRIISNLLSMSILLQKRKKFTSQSFSWFKMKRTKKQDWRILFVPFWLKINSKNSRTKFKIAKNFLITKKERIMVLPTTFFLSPTLQDFFINHKSINLSTIYGFKPFMTLWHYLIHPRKSSKPSYLTPFPCQPTWIWKGTLTLPSQLFFKYLVKTSTSFTIILTSF